MDKVEFLIVVVFSNNYIQSKIRKCSKMCVYVTIACQLTEDNTAGAVKGRPCGIDLETSVTLGLGAVGLTLCILKQQCHWSTIMIES